jgi:leucyl/phenylalanyl-tRNA---protein transferase
VQYPTQKLKTLKLLYLYPMPVFALDDSPVFPPPHLAESDGLLAIGGDLSPRRLLNAYQNGIFPWYDSPPVLWWSPDPRFVLFPQELHISRSMKQVMKSGRFTFTINQAFEQVIGRCQKTVRPGQEGTWINDDMKAAYIRLHREGHAHSAEAWLNGQLAGGLYGILAGGVFCGESMFSQESNASKFAFINWVQHLRGQGVQLIDCQVYTEHLESFGARMIPRALFLRILHGG